MDLMDSSGGGVIIHPPDLNCHKFNSKFKGKPFMRSAYVLGVRGRGEEVEPLFFPMPKHVKM